MPKDSLALVRKLDLLKEKYKILSEFLFNHLGERILPGYDALLAEKVKCYPQNLIITETSLES